jgi:hypothetical protein
MSEQNNKAATKKFLSQLYKNTKMGADSIIDIMPKVANEELKSELTSELEKYEDFSKKIKTMLFDLGMEAHEENAMTKVMTKVGITMNTMLDASASHIADIMIQGATMGITDTTKLVREYENTSCSEDALALAKETIKYEEATVERLKKFL